MRSNAAGSGREGRTREARVARAFPRDVRAPAPAQLPIFRSRLQGELLARLLLGPEREMSMLDLAVMLHTDLASVMREAERLARAGILALRRTLAGRLVKRNLDSPLYEPLVHLLMVTFGPAAVVAEEFGRLPAVREIHLFGAWADRYEHPTGIHPADVDVLVIGHLTPDAAFDAAQEAAARLALPVHPVVRTPSQWRDDTDPFLREIRNGPVVAVRPLRPT
ncbi:ArsR family transcriptional regulator [Actinomadura spongiicola]|uniref:ArsR family transcriptional regulator n=1 Tax=Actinomadura spongiicola TaxID=2303421 RepID=A0A372GDA2_9ACTN|nr:ArsR family transcriptional regulator [Actinomadura spongiicola]RFS83307.1 ArsR family transcriptional regulator [Actinomadura spongiicola]